ncbi:proton-dependent oligopeptide transporter family protein [Tanacetum coccineum]
MSKSPVLRVMTSKESLWVGCRHGDKVSGAITTEENLPSQIVLHEKPNSSNSIKTLLSPSYPVFHFVIYCGLVAVAQGGHKPCVQAFGADQFDTNNPEERKAKSSFFNWWYFRFLNKALVSPDGSDKDGAICSIDEVEETKVVLRLVPIWTSLLGFAIVFAQTSTLYTKQAATLDRAITNKPSGITMLQRIGTGIVFSILLMVVAAVVETKRLKTANEYGLVDDPSATIPMKVWWLLPQCLLAGAGDVFTIVGMQEFFYEEMPNDLKSIGLALYLSVLGIGSFLSSFLISIVEKMTSGNGQDGWISDNVNKGHIDYFYYLLAGISAGAFMIYIYVAKSYVYDRGRAL